MDFNKEIKYRIPSLNEVKLSSDRNLFTVVSTFAGVGGSSTGYRMAGGRVLAINEFIEEASRCYSVNYPETHVFKQDIRELTGKMILDKIQMNVGDLDILDGSPPCASFSMAGKREKNWGKIKKYSDTKQRTDDLFFEFGRILERIKPRVFITENVKGLTSGIASNLLGSEQYSLFDNDKDTIFHFLASKGYNIRYKVLNAKDYGVPQSRERLFIIGVRKDINKAISFPVKQDHIVTLKEAIDDIEFISQAKCREDFRPEYIENTNEINKYFSFLKEGQKVSEIHPKQSGFSYMRLDRNDVCPTICQASDRHYIHYNHKKFINIAELKRICSFPDDYYVGDIYKKQWERLGRAVPPLLMKAIAEHLYETILK